MPPALTDPLFLLFGALLLVAVVAAAWLWRSESGCLPPDAASGNSGGEIPVFSRSWPVAVAGIGMGALWFGDLAVLFQPFVLVVLVWAVAVIGIARAPMATRGQLRFIGAGLALAMAVGFGAWLVARPFLTQGWAGLSSLVPFGSGLALALAAALRLVLARKTGGRR